MTQVSWTLSPSASIDSVLEIILAGKRSIGGSTVYSQEGSLYHHLCCKPNLLIQVLQEQGQLDAIRNEQGQEQITSEQIGSLDRDFEGGFGGQEDLEDRYATTSGEH